MQVRTRYYTKKIPEPIEAATAKKTISDLLKWDVVIQTGESVLEAIEMHLHYQIPFWDSMIIRAALEGGAFALKA